MEADILFMLVFRQHVEHINRQISALVKIKYSGVHSSNNCISRLHICKYIDGIAYDIPNLFFHKESLRFPFYRK
jgi:hypothetical protein